MVRTRRKADMNALKTRHSDAIEAAIALAKASGKRETAVSEYGLVVYAAPQADGSIAWGVHLAKASAMNLVEGIRLQDGSDSGERCWWDDPNELPAEPIEPLPVPTVEEVCEWRKSQDRVAAMGIHHYWTAEGLARQAAFREAEKRYKAEGLL